MMANYFYDATTGKTRIIPNQAEYIHEQMRDDLSELEDALCGLFGQDSRMLYDITIGPARERAERDLTTVLDMLRDFEAKYDLEWKPKK